MAYVIRLISKLLFMAWPSKFSFITSMVFFDNQKKTIKEFIYASLLLGVCRLQSILVLWHLSHLRWFLSPYIEPQVSCQQSESPLGLIFMVCVSLQVSMTCVALPFMVHFSRCVLYFFYVDIYSLVVVPLDFPGSAEVDICRSPDFISSLFFFRFDIFSHTTCFLHCD